MKKYSLPVIFILIIILLVYINPIMKVGFLSDDFALIYRTKNEPVLAPFDHGHFAPIIKILFILAGSTSYSILNIASLCFHLINTFLVYIITRKCMDIEYMAALVITLLFAINSAGMEALIWHCAIAYVILTTWILVSLYFFLKFLNSHELMKTSLIITLMQILSLLTWEWGILLFPFLIIITIFIKLFKIKSYNNVPSLKNLLLCILPAFICLLIAFFIPVSYTH